MGVETYVEDQPLVLPNVEGGPTGIGDLWNCHTSKSVKWNLFGRQLSAEHLAAEPRKSMAYKLTHVRSTGDRHKHLDVSGEVALELLGGKMN